MADDEFLSVLTEGMVRNGILLGETWSSICTRKVKALPSAMAQTVIKKELSPDEARLAKYIYEQRVKENNELDIDDIVVELLEKRKDRLCDDEIQRAHQLHQKLHLLKSNPNLCIKIKRTFQGSDIILMTPLQFATYFGDIHIVKVLVKAGVSLCESLIEAAREGYAQVVEAILDSRNVLGTCKPHDIGHAFYIAAKHAHLDVLKWLEPHIPMEYLCQGSWCTHEQLGMRYIAAAAHAAVDINNLEVLQYILSLPHLLVYEVEYLFNWAMERACHQSSDELAIACLPILTMIIHTHPILVSIAKKWRTQSTRGHSIASHILFDLHTNTIS